MLRKELLLIFHFRLQRYKKKLIYANFSYVLRNKNLKNPMKGFLCFAYHVFCCSTPWKRVFSSLPSNHVTTLQVKAFQRHKQKKQGSAEPMYGRKRNNIVGNERNDKSSTRRRNCQEERSKKNVAAIKLPNELTANMGVERLYEPYYVSHWKDTQTFALREGLT